LHDRVLANPNAFDARRDGVEFIQQMRGLHPRPCKLGPRAAVGGFITHTTITREGIGAEVIWEWPDRVGECIDADNVGSSVSGRQINIPTYLEAISTMVQQAQPAAA
jgi:hypothetical protein